MPRDPVKAKAYQKAYYKKYAESKKKRAVLDKINSVRRNQAYVNERKAAPCMDCKNTFPPICMDFDHVVGTKEGDVSVLARKGCSLQKIQDEIDKCQLVCANCHRIRTQERQKRQHEVHKSGVI